MCERYVVRVRTIAAAKDDRSVARVAATVRPYAAKQAGRRSICRDGSAKVRRVQLLQRILRRIANAPIILPAQLSNALEEKHAQRRGRQFYTFKKRIIRSRNLAVSLVSQSQTVSTPQPSFFKA